MSACEYCGSDERAQLGPFFIPGVDVAETAVALFSQRKSASQIVFYNDLTIVWQKVEPSAGMLNEPYVRSVHFKRNEDAYELMCMAPCATLDNPEKFGGANSIFFSNAEMPAIRNCVITTGPPNKRRRKE